MNKNVKIIVIIAVIVVIIFAAIAGTGIYLVIKNENGIVKIGNNLIPKGKKDDWVYDAKHKSSTDVFNKISGFSSNYASNNSVMLTESEMPDMMSVSSKSSSESTLGYSVGGSKNIENFRKNIENGYFPISTDITYNGLFYDYYFNTGKTKESTELFSPSYSLAISKDPISQKNEYYMTVGLNSNIKESDFKRKKQNIMIVLDISGSMGSSLKSYYYDGNEEKDTEEKEIKSKMKLANEAVNLMIDELKEDDRFGIVLFDDNSYLAKPINLVKDTDIDKIKNHVLEIKEDGGTNFEAGYTKATECFNKELLNDEEYDNRIIVITDAMPNLGKTNKSELSKYVRDNAEKNIYTTFIGVGVDFNTEVIEDLSDVKGANYYSISSSKQFKKVLSEDFDYMVTPLVFDLNLNFKSDSYEIAEVYGTDSKDKTNGNIIHVNTLFPSSTDSESGSKGGVILLKLKKKENQSDGIINLDVSYKDTSEKKYTNSEKIQFTNDDEFYANTGIRKSIVLVRYANCLKNWILYERKEDREIKEKFIINEQTGITDCIYTKNEIYRILGENERVSTKLTVGNEYKEIFRKIKPYIEKEKDAVNDDTLKQEVEILDKLINK